MAQCKKSHVLLANAFLVSLLFFAGCTAKKSGPAAPSSGPRQLRVFTWSDYLNDQVVKDFEKEHNVKVVLDYFSSNEELLAKVQASLQAGSRGYDVIFPSDYMAGNMITLKMLQPLDKSRLKFLPEFEKSFLNPAYDPGLSHVVPFAWGTTGVAWNTKLASATNFLGKALSWKDLLENKKFAQKATLLDDAKECLHVALLIQGVKWQAAGEPEIRKAFDYLKAHKSNIRIFTAQAQSRPVMEAGECALCQAYSGDALLTIKKKPELRYQVPVEGGTIWTDNMAIPNNAAERDLAYDFMNKVLAKESAKLFTEQTFFASPNGEARALLEADLRKNTAIFPDAATFQKLEYLTEKPDQLTLIDRLWTELKSQ